MKNSRRVVITRIHAAIAIENASPTAEPSHRLILARLEYPNSNPKVARHPG